MLSYGEQLAHEIAYQLHCEKDKHKMTEDMLAQKLGIHRVSVSRYLSGARDIPFSVFIDMCDALHVSIDDIIMKAKKHLKKENNATTSSHLEKR